MRPCASVRVGFSNSDYDNVCVSFGGGDDLLPAWRDLGDLLAHRSGWHFDVVNDGEALWSLGLLGESRLNIHVTEDRRYHCHDHDTDRDDVVDGIPAVEDWLSTREDRAKQPSALLLDMARAMDWGVLKSHPFTLRVSWSDGYFAASLPDHYDVAFGSTLPEAISGASEMLCRLFDAPSDLAAHLTLTTELDTTATRRLTGQAG
jgi:hypothetical protein